MDIYVQKGSQQHGPYPEARVRQGIDAGEFDPADLAWTTGKASWQPLSALINLDVSKPPPLSSLSGAVQSRLQKSLPRTDNETPSPFITVSNQVDAPVIPDRPPHPPSGPSRTSNISRPRQEPLSSRIYTWSAYIFLGIVVIGVGWKGLQAFLPIFEDEEQDDVYHLKQDTRTQSSSNDLAHNGKSKQLFDNERFGQTPVPPDVRRANLWGTEPDFIKVYGEPVRRSHGSIPPGTEILHFLKDGLVYDVTFWQERAHQVVVLRKDHQALNDEQVQQTLRAFAGGDEWSHKAFSGSFRPDKWERTSAIAWIVLARKEYPDKQADIPETMLTISTNEFSAAWDQASKSLK